MNTDIKKDITKISRDQVKMETLLDKIESNIYLLMRSFHSINILDDTDVDTENNILRGENENEIKKKNATKKKKEKEINFTKTITKKVRRKKRKKIVWNSWIIDTSSESSSSGCDFS